MHPWCLELLQKPASKKKQRLETGADATAETEANRDRLGEARGDAAAAAASGDAAKAPASGDEAAASGEAAKNTQRKRARAAACTQL